MKKAAWLFGCCLAAPLSAQSFELGLFAGRQSYRSFTATPAPGTTFTGDLDAKTVVGARFGYALVDLGPALFQLTAGYQPEASTAATVAVTGIGSGQTDIKESHWSLGAMFHFKALVAIGAGVEYRSESLKGLETSTTYGRPWVRFNVGYAFPAPLLKPFIGLEADFPLTSQSNDYSSAAEVLKSVAPRNQVGLYGGIRF